jgi:hypothetical protein
MISDTLVSLLTLEGTLSIFSPCHTMLPINLSSISYIILKYVVSIPSFFRVLSGVGYGFFSKVLPTPIGMIM